MSDSTPSSAPTSSAADLAALRAAAAQAAAEAAEAKAEAAAAALAAAEAAAAAAGATSAAADPPQPVAPAPAPPSPHRRSRRPSALRARRADRRRLHVRRTDAPGRRPGRGRRRDPRRAGRHPARDDEPPRPGRGRDRHRQDQDAPGARPRACRPRGSRSSSPTSRATCPGWPSRARRARSCWPARRASGRTGWRRRRRWSSSASAASVRASPVRTTVTDFGPLLLAKVLGPERDAGVEPRPDHALGGHAGAGAAGPQGPAGDDRVPGQRRGQAAAQGHRRAVGGDRGRDPARDRVAAGPGRRRVLRGARVRRLRAAADHARTAAASSARWSCPPCRTGRRCSRRSSCGCWPSCSRRSPRWATPTSRSSCSSSTRRTCCSRARRSDFLTQVTQTVRLIRSKGVGVFFVTQSPKDVPGDVLAQLGNRVQHALRAFTPDDAKALRAAARTFPTSPYDLEQLLQSLGTGEAVVTVQSERGTPTPVAWTRLRAPQSSMEPMPAADLAVGSRRRRPCPPGTPSRWTGSPRTSCWLSGPRRRRRRRASSRRPRRLRTAPTRRRGRRDGPRRAARPAGRARWTACCGQRALSSGVRSRARSSARAGADGHRHSAAPERRARRRARARSAPAPTHAGAR